jgi:hypothetical protein
MKMQQRCFWIWTTIRGIFRLIGLAGNLEDAIIPSSSQLDIILVCIIVWPAVPRPLVSLCES